MLLWIYLIIYPSVYFENLQIHISKLFILNRVNLERISFLNKLLSQRKGENKNLELQLFQINLETLVILIFANY